MYSQGLRSKTKGQTNNGRDPPKPLITLTQCQQRVGYWNRKKICEDITDKNFPHNENYKPKNTTISTPSTKKESYTIAHHYQGP